MSIPYVHTCVAMYVTMYVCTFVYMQQNYGTAQQQLDTRTCVNGKKRVGKLNEYVYAKPAWVPVTI